MGLKLQRANINLVENRLILAPEWGSITGDITEQEDLNQILTSVNSELETLDNSLNTTNTNLANLEQTTEGINNRLSGVEQTYATKSELNQLSTDLDNLTDSALTEQDADNKYALKNGSISEDFKAKSLYIAPYSIQVEGGELSFFHNGGRTNIHLPEDMGSGTVALTKNYYDKTEIDNKLSNLDLSIFEIVNELPTTNINENKIYLVRNDQTTGSNLYTEYRYTNNSWEVLGEYKSDVDLADYYTKDQVEEYVSDNIISPHAFSQVFNSCYTTEWLDPPFTPTNMANLANKSEVYTKSEIDTKIGDIESILATL